MNLVGAIFSTLTAALVVLLPGISASLVRFALSFALQCNTAIAFALRQYANNELNVNATERVIEYSNIELENQGGVDAPAAWPTEGRLEVHDLVLGYVPDLPPVLRGLSFTAEKNRRVGVEGRTGAGKSSLTLALFRFLEPRQGQIFIRRFGRVQNQVMICVADSPSSRKILSCFLAQCGSTWTHSMNTPTPNSTMPWLECI